MSDQDATQGTDGATDGAENATAAAETVTHDAAPSSSEPVVRFTELTIEPLIVRVEQLARRAFDAGQTDEHNLMAWLYQHIDALKRAIAGAPGLPLSDEAKALLAELAELL
ncbi:hypothetical protein WJ32_08425 [Burkholderia ubonensis]|uniref:Uncharacterized protein n=1 Tax=Burkholderia ubonensis TaxID=101571 RepID=A0A103QVQ4_9BURK|nr:hypothetical protein [Burkholderia ubonensis]AOJ62480.1 hypothetical protein WJ32_08425 [Burkholderia ubonensis]KVG56443.1 hypothetical protein WJ33_37090 [Burkholderia ubonensis]